MPSNATLNAGSGGVLAATKQVTHDGDTAHTQVISLVGVSGTEDNYTIADINGDATNGLDVDVTRVGGTVTVDNAGTFAVQVDGAALTSLQNIETAVELIDNAISGTEMQVDIVTSALPTGASTAANQSTIIGHVDGIEGLLTTIDADTSNVSTNSDTVAAGFAADAAALGSGVLIQGDDGTDRKNINVDATTGDVQVDVTNTVTVDGSAVTQPISAASLPLPAGAATENTVATIETNTDFGTVTGGGVEATALRVTLANDSTGVVSIDDNGGSLTVDGTVTANLSATDNAVLDNIQTAVELIDNAISGTEMQVDVVAALPAGTNAIGKLAANSGVDIGDVDVLSIAAGTNLIGDVAIQPRSTGGHTGYRNTDVDETEDEISSSQVALLWLHAATIDATPVYLHLYNATAASVTVGTTTPLLTFLVPSSGDANGAGFTQNFGPDGVNFSTAMSIAATTTVGGSTGPGANEVIVSLGYR